MLQIRRIYDEPTAADGYRVLVDRLWPRGISKDRARLDEWLKEIAPSPELRTWFCHRPELFTEFAVRYELELDANPATKQLEDIIKAHKAVTLIYAAHDPIHNQAQVLLRHYS